MRVAVKVGIVLAVADGVGVWGECRWSGSGSGHGSGSA